MHQLPVERIETDGSDPDENLAVTRRGLRGFLAVKNVRGTKVAIDDGFHAMSCLDTAQG